MSTGRKSGILAVLAAALVVGFGVALSRQHPAVGQGADAGRAGAPHYTVVHTEGHNLIVTDNQSNTLYFYTIDRDAEIGADLKLRGTLDLNQVGKPVLHPISTRAKAQGESR